VKTAGRRFSGVKFNGGKGGSPLHFGKKKKGGGSALRKKKKKRIASADKWEKKKKKKQRLRCELPRGKGTHLSRAGPMSAAPDQNHEIREPALSRRRERKRLRIRKHSSNFPPKGRRQKHGKKDTTVKIRKRKHVKRIKKKKN